MRKQGTRKRRAEIEQAKPAPLGRLKDVVDNDAAFGEWLKRFQALPTGERNRVIRDNPDLPGLSRGGNIAEGDLLIGPLAAENNGDRDEGEFLFLMVLRPMRERLIAEYGLKTGAELMLVDAVVLSYYQYTRAAGSLHGLTAYGRSYNYETLVKYAQTYMARANEMLLRNLEALRQMKAVPFTLKIAQAGQVNVGEKQLNVAETPAAAEVSAAGHGRRTAGTPAGNGVPVPLPGADTEA